MRYLGNIFDLTCVAVQDDSREQLVRKVQKYEDVLCKYINDQQFRKIIERLFETRGISLDFIDEIKSESTRFDRVLHLLSFIYKCDLQVINTFLSVLEFEFPHLYTEITGRKSGKYDKIVDVSTF